MNRLQIFIFICIFCFSAMNVIAQGGTAPEVPVGMEVIYLGAGGGQVIVPKGAKTRQVGAQLIVEGTKEYMSRMVHEMGLRMTTIEERLDGLEKTMESLTDIVQEMQANAKLASLPPAPAPVNPPGPEQAKAKEQQIETIDGEVSKVDPSANTIVVKVEGREMAFFVANGAKITRKEDKIRLQDIYQADMVTVLYDTPSVGTYVALSIADNSPAR
jgi:hypothetical protein